MRRVAIKDGGVAGTNLARVVEDDDLGVERFRSFWRIVFGIASNIATTDLLDTHVLD